MDVSPCFGLLGYPLGHTLSPPIHHRLFELAGRTGRYELFEIPPQALPSRITELRKLSGFNVTIPHKRAILPFLDELSQGARRYGAVNTVTCEDGRMVGYNTDVEGFIRSLTDAGVNTQGQRSLVLGAGGAGRMMAIELSLRQGEVTLAVRPGGEKKGAAVLEDIRALSPKAQVRLATLESLPRLMAEEGGFDLLCNATPAGMYPQVDQIPVPEAVAAGCGCVFDAIYNPGETRLMAAARRHGVTAIGGMAMLVWQAVAAHEIWDGSRYDSADIQALIQQMAL